MLAMVISASQPNDTAATNSFWLTSACGARFAAGEREDAGHVDQQHRHVEQIVGPVAPAGQESVRVAELLARPEIDAALAGIAAAEHQHGDRFGHEEGDEREQPQRQRRPSRRPRPAARC